jgi:hypothetical protein
LTLRQGENIIVAEVFYSYSPVFFGTTPFMKASLIRRIMTTGARSQGKREGEYAPLPETSG